MPFSTLSLDGYGTNAVTISDKIWLQSPLAEKHNAWYLLRRPSKEYARFHTPFLWLADFSKHFVAYLDSKQDSRHVRLHDFKTDFYDWLIAQHGTDPSFQAWFEMFGSKDFRTVIAANYEFLWKESVIVQDEHRKCYLWREVDAKALSAVPLQPQKVHNTIVTPYVYECFKRMYFASAMECRKPVEEVCRASLQRTTAFEASANVAEVFPGGTRGNTAKTSSTPARIAVGDVVQLARDSKSAWKDTAESWYAYVQAVDRRKHEDVLRVIWLYRPEDTPCAKMHYPYKKELFFSDHCNCGSAAMPPSEVVRKVKVKFGRADSGNNYDFFVRQTYITDEDDARYASFVTFRTGYTRCGCEGETDSAPTYKEGETVLVSGLPRGRLEPVILLEQTSGSARVQVRKLRRRGRDFNDPDAKANELVYTEETAFISVKQVERRCNVRVYTHDQVKNREVPAPYSYNGTGDCWILTGKLEEGRLQDIPQEHMKNLPMLEGFDPQADTGRAPLQGLSLFCGGGSFDRGFEESGAVRFTHSVDWAQKAIHTCRANSTDPDKLKLFYGNVNDFIARAIVADASTLIPQVGSIRFMTAGSPCVAFSRLQNDGMSESSLRNASLVAALITAVDVYRPDYGVFENVFAMGSNRGANKDENVLSQMVCCLVGMGYQVQIFNQDAHSAGSGQQRSRLLLSIAAPGLVPLNRPSMTHSHPSNTSERVVGTASNGVPFGKRTFEETPFKHATAESTLRDLPNIEDAMVNMCMPYPDHRVSSIKRFESAMKIRHIPRFPQGCS